MIPTDMIFEISNILGEQSNKLRQVCKTWADTVPIKQDSAAYMTRRICQILRSLSETCSTCPIVLKIYSLETTYAINIQLQYTAMGPVIMLLHHGDVFASFLTETTEPTVMENKVYQFLDKYRESMTQFKKGIDEEGVYTYVSHPDGLSPIVVGLLYNMDMNIGEVGPYMFPYVSCNWTWKIRMMQLDSQSPLKDVGN